MCRNVVRIFCFAVNYEENSGGIFTPLDGLSLNNIGYLMQNVGAITPISFNINIKT